MKQRTIWTGLWALVFALGLSTLTPAVRTQAQSQQPNSPQAQDQQKSGTFVGEVVKAKNGQYALLVDKEQGKGYYLDNEAKAKQFEGQNVKVIGVLDASTSTIHVSEIVPA
jgi:hypothetical protein